MIHIHDIQSIKGWTKHYVEEGQRYLSNQHKSNTTPSLESRKAAEDHLRIYIPKALQIKASQLRNSNSRDLIVGFTTLAAIAPFGKLIASTIGAGFFREKVIEEYGLESDEPVFWLILQAMADAGVIHSAPRSLTSMLIEKIKKFAKDKLEFAWHEGDLRDEVHEELIREFGEVLGDEIFGEATSLVPIIGTVISCKRGEQRAIKKLDAIIQSTQEVALRVHESIVVPVVLEELGLGLKQIQESVPVASKPAQEDWDRIRMQYMQPPSSITYQSTPQIIHPQPRKKDQATQKANKAALDMAATAEPTANFIFITVFILVVCILFSPVHYFEPFNSFRMSYWLPIQFTVVAWTIFWRRTIWRGGNWTLLPKVLFVLVIFFLADLVLITAIAYEIGSVFGMYRGKDPIPDVRSRKRRDLRN